MRFEYDQRSLNERIYWNMVENGYLGVACGPFCVFQICNQVPILSFRLGDHLYGDETAEEVTRGYERAWRDFGGGVNEEGHFAAYVVQPNSLLATNVLVDDSQAWSDGWLGMLMNMWRPELVAGTYRAKIDRWLDRTPDGTIAVHPGGTIGRRTGVVQPGTLGEVGWIAAWASEMGDEEVVAGMPRHADAFMNPQWDNGGLFYPRQDATYDADGRYVAVTTTVGNALFPYARLNVKDGLRQIFENPWGEREHTRPALVEVGVQVWRDGDLLHLSAMLERGCDITIVWGRQ